MHAIEPWVEAPLRTFLAEAGARVVLLATAAGQVVAQHGFTRSLDVMSAAALGAAIVASTRELGALLGERELGAVVHQGHRNGIFLAAFDTPRGRWLALVVFGAESSVGLVQVFFRRLVETLAAAAPVDAPTPVALAEDFERDLNASLRALFGR